MEGPPLLALPPPPPVQAGFSFQKVPRGRRRRPAGSLGCRRAMASSESGAKLRPRPSDPMVERMTELDRQYVRDVWAMAFDNAEENGRLVIIRFFTDRPASKKYFKSVPTEGDLQTHPQSLFQAILCTFQDLLGEEFTAEKRVSWEKFFQIVQEEVEAAYAR